MKTMLLLACAMIALEGYSQDCQCQEQAPKDLTVGTYNLRMACDWDRERGNGWEQRVPNATDLVEFIMPDAFGAQEMFAEMIADVQRLMPEYDYIGTGRDGIREGEHSPIFYNREKLKPLRSSTFWLSETPDTVSRGWDAACNRVCTWGEFEVLGSPDTLYYFNTHMDHVGVEARRRGAQLIVERISEIVPNPNAKIILTGDFNVDQTDEIYQIFTDSGLIDSYEAADRRWAPNGTFNNYNSDTYTTSRIDHVFLSPSIHPARYAVLTDAYWVVDDQAETSKSATAPQEIDFTKQQRRLPSDHYPVFVKIQY